MADSPLVSVIMPVYHSDLYLKDAIESILKQTHDNFEFLIIVDEPTASTKQIIDKYAQNDKRIIAHYQENRTGLINSLNLGCEEARGMYLARMDADDICVSDRIEKQVKFMEDHPEVCVLGTWTVYVNEKGGLSDIFHPPSNENLMRWYLLFGNYLAHPSVIMRKDILVKFNFYSQEATYAEDYDLWARISPICKISNISEILLKYRIASDSVCSRNKQNQEDMVTKISHTAIQTFIKSEIPIDIIKNLRVIVKGEGSLEGIEQVNPVKTLIMQLYDNYKETTILTNKDIKEMSHHAGKLLIRLSINSKGLTIRNRLDISSDALRLSPLILFELSYEYLMGIRLRLKARNSNFN